MILTRYAQRTRGFQLLTLCRAFGGASIGVKDVILNSQCREVIRLLSIDQMIILLVLTTI